MTKTKTARGTTRRRKRHPYYPGQVLQLGEAVHLVIQAKFLHPFGYKIQSVLIGGSTPGEKAEFFLSRNPWKISVVLVEDIDRFKNSCEKPKSEIE